MLATLSAENRSLTMMRELGISNAFVASLCSIEQTKLSYAFRGLKSLPNDEGHRLVLTLARLIEIREAVAALSIDLKSPANTQSVLDAFEGQDAKTIRQKISAVFD